jgi:hypothetical protein
MGEGKITRARQAAPLQFNQDQRVVRLLLAALDNLQKHALGAELEDVGYFLNDVQREFLAKLAVYTNRVTDEDDDR